MSESLLETLCDKQWAMDPDTSRTIQFFQDGTGEVSRPSAHTDANCSPARGSFANQSWQFVIRVGFHLLIASKFTYTLSAQKLTLTLSPTRLATINAQPLKPQLPLNDAFLLPEAFEPKTFEIQIEEGTFPVSFGPRGEHGTIMQWCRQRLVFDRTPVPRIEEWREKHKVENYSLWDKRDFYAEVIPAEEVKTT